MRVGRTYVYNRDTRGKSMTAFVVLAAISGAVGVWTSISSFKHFRTYRDVSASLGSLVITPSTPGIGYGSVFDIGNTGHVVHVNIPQSDILFDHYVYDPFFGVYGPNALTLNRRVEYCQWQEHVHERTEKTGEHTERVVRTYTYTKGWHSHTINSFFFNQPAAHFNPQRQPVTSGQVDISGVSSRSGFRIPTTYMGYLKAETRTFSYDRQSLQGFVSSPAYTNENFFYTGNGWFLSKYEPSRAEQAMKMSAQYLEGTLFDFQLGDLFSVCDAGDVRVSFDGKVVNNGVSAIALQNSDGTLSPFKTLSGKDIMMVQEGQVTAEEMMERELSDRFWSLVWFVFGAVVSVGLTALFIHLTMKEKERTEKENNENKKEQ